MRPKDIGTRAEAAVVRYLAAHGWPLAERRALHGIHDLGDITGTPGIVWEVKGGEAAQADAIDRLLAAVPRLIGLIEERHTAEHSGLMMLCADPLCDAVSLR